MSIDPKRVKEIFLEAAELPDEAAKAAFLDRACGSDAGVRARVEVLLRSHEPDGSFLGTPAGVVPDPDFAGTIAFPDGATEADGSPDGDEVPLGFLAPPGRSDSLGRIGHYEVLQVLGHGGFGIVFRAFDEVLHRVVAVKVLAPQLAATSPARKRFLREARSSAQVRHENVVQVYEVGETPLPYLVMEFIPGETLQQRLDRTGPLDVPDILRTGRQIAEGLAAAHATDLIHRDIKPGNVLLEGGAQRVKITDFGLARAADDASISQSGIIAGTPMYMAPEQAKGEHIDHRADLFSLGSVLYQMTAGRAPFRATGTLAVLKRVAEDAPRPIREIIPEAPQWLCDIISKLHAKNPDERYQSAREVADVLADCATQLKSNAKLKDFSRIPTSKQPVTKSSGRRKWVAIVGLMAFFVTGLIAAAGLLFRTHEPGTVTIRTNDPELVLTLDGQLVNVYVGGIPDEANFVHERSAQFGVTPGEHRVLAMKEGRLVREESFTIRRGESRALEFMTARPPKPPSAIAPPTPVAKQEPPPAADPDRTAAESALSLGGIVRIEGVDREIKAVADLPQGALRLTWVSLGGNDKVTDAGLAAFKDCKNLAVINLSFTAVGDAGLDHLKDCPGLTSLDLRFTQLTDAGLVHLKDRKNLTYLNLTACEKVTDAGLAHLKGCEQLESIALDGTQVTDAGLAHLKGCGNLREMHLPGLPITDAGLDHLAGLDKLIELNLVKTKVTAKGAEGLAKALPKCKIQWDGGTIEPK